MKWPLVVRWRSKLIWSVRGGRTNFLPSEKWKHQRKLKSPRINSVFFNFQVRSLRYRKKRQERYKKGKMMGVFTVKNWVLKAEIKKKSKWILSRADVSIWVSHSFMCAIVCFFYLTLCSRFQLGCRLFHRLCDFCMFDLWEVYSSVKWQKHHKWTCGLIRNSQQPEDIPVLDSWTYFAGKFLNFYSGLWF